MLEALMLYAHVQCRALINNVGNSFCSTAAQPPNTVMLLDIISAGMIGGILRFGELPLTGLNKTLEDG
jgi:hypothetical protein